MNGKLKLALGINPFKFIRWNFMSGSVERDKGKYIITNWGSVIDISKTAKVILHGNLFLNGPKYRHSREEAYLLLRDGATLTEIGRASCRERV